MLKLRGVFILQALTITEPTRPVFWGKGEGEKARWLDMVGVSQWFY